MAVTKVEATGWQGRGVKVNDIKVVGEQTAVIADASVAHSLTDAAAELATALEAELNGQSDALGTKINAILASLRAHGLIDTA